MAIKYFFGRFNDSGIHRKAVTSAITVCDDVDQRALMRTTCAIPVILVFDGTTFPDPFENGSPIKIDSLQIEGMHTYVGFVSS